MWTDEKQKWEEPEKRREEKKREDQRRERIRRKKMQVREKVGKSPNTVYFQ
jgi:ribosomal protein L18